MQSRIAGRASAEATNDYLERHAAGARGRTLAGARLSSIGIGTYLGEDSADNDALYREAIETALDSGINVIDTAINYRSQRSERTIGEALRAALDKGSVKREEVLVASKAGYLPSDGERPRSRREFESHVQKTYFEPGIMKPEEFVSGCHCMAPRYLEDQLERSRTNLGLDTIDVYYVHNPETQFDAVDRAGFLSRLKSAFELLEGAARDNRIGVYGTATWNGFRVPPAKSGHLSLEEIVQVARSVGGSDHHFKVVQLPYNLAMPEAHEQRTQSLNGNMVTLLEAAKELGVYVMASASLLQGQLTERLPDELRSTLGLRTDAQRALQFVRSTPGIGTALVGMKSKQHVLDAREVERTKPLDADTVQSLFDNAG